MNKILYLTKKEIKAILFSPYTIILWLVYFSLFGYLVLSQINASHKTNLELIFPNLLIIFLFFIPLLSCKSLSDEKKNGTYKLYVMTPTSVFELLASKFLSIYVIAVLAFFINLLQILCVRVIGIISFRFIFTSFIGFFLISFAFVSICIFISAIFDHHHYSFMVSFLTLLFIFALNTLNDKLPGALSIFYSQIGLFRSFTPFANGVLNGFHIINYIFVGVLFFYLTHLVIEKRWVE